MDRVLAAKQSAPRPAVPSGESRGDRALLRGARGNQPGQFDRNALDEPQDVVEYWAVAWSRSTRNHNPPQLAGTGLGLSVDWYRDILRAKLVSLRLPRRLLLEYKSRVVTGGESTDLA
jgi:hypothetical protein